MRAYEFIPESKRKIVKTGVKPSKESEAVMTGAHRVAGTADRHYDLNRIMQYVACSDGKNMTSPPKESWSGRNNTAHPYTKEELLMLKHAYKEYGAEWDDALYPNPSNKSVEPKEVQTKSPINPFSGYLKK